MISVEQGTPEQERLAAKLPLKGLWEHLMGHFAFRMVVLLLGFPVLFVLTMMKIAFFHGNADVSNVKASDGNAKPTPVPERQVVQAASVASAPAIAARHRDEALESLGPVQAPLCVPASLHHVVRIDEAVVNFGVYASESSPRITRLVKVRTDRLPWQRARIAFRRYKLADFTPALAEATKLSYTLAGAVSLTRRDLKSTPAQASAVHNAGKVKAIPVVDFDAKAVDDTKPAARPTVATGVVTSAGMVKVTRSGGKPYSAFQIVVADGLTRAIFTGVDLLEKFNNNVFGMHDRIRIEKVREEFEVEDGGRKSKRQKNTYKIEVLEKTQN